MSERTVNGLARDQFKSLLWDISSTYWEPEGTIKTLLDWFDGLRPDPAPASVDDPASAIITAVREWRRVVDDPEAMMEDAVLVGFLLRTALDNYDAFRAAPAAPEEGKK